MLILLFVCRYIHVRMWAASAPLLPPSLLEKQISNCLHFQTAMEVLTIAIPSVQNDQVRVAQCVMKTVNTQ